MRRSPAEIALSLGVLALGIGVAAVTATLPSEGGYSGIGPNFIPAVVASGMIVLGVWLGVKLLRRLPAVWFYRLVSCGLLITGLKLTWDGLR